MAHRILIRTSTLALLLIVIFTIEGFNQTKERRLALVIGNADYQYSGKLKNTVNDANLMAQTLKDLGFDVIKKTNGTKTEMDQAILDFSRQLGQYNVALFFYAGHGIQLEGTNYLIPVDARLDDRLAAQFEAVDVGKLVSQFERYPNNVNIVILDACRNNPFKTWTRGGEAGFKAIPAPSGTIIAFATGEGATASDGTGQNGLYTSELVEQMRVPQRIEDVFIETRVQVRARSENKQSPQEWSQLTGKFYFTPANQNGTSNSAAPPVSKASNVSAREGLMRGSGATEFETKNIIAELLRSGHSVLDILDSHVPKRYLYGLDYQGGIIVEIDEETNTGILVSPYDLARGGKATWDEARKLCESFANDNYDDWSLPSKATLEQIYQNVAKAKFGNFAPGVYWSASESGYSHAWGKSFNSGGNYDFDKTSQQYVRAVRTFRLK
ncbi:MAG TPA: caspase family protein [Chryseosolibacter sp.]|nr:caspase family protein [Chryseosolibacter sp.]